MHDQLVIRRATTDDANAVAALVERAYRGEASRAGWTSEADLIGGRRTNEDEIAALIAEPRSVTLVGTQRNRVVACCHLEQRHPGTAYLGTFAVEPTIQGSGLGRRMISAAFDHARTEMDATDVQIEVVAQQTELIAWYERLDFRPTGQQRPFPSDAKGAIPLVEGVHFVVMRRSLPHPDQRVI